MAGATTDRAWYYRLPDIPILAMGLLSSAAIASVVGLLIADEARDRRETPGRIAACHAQEGTARLDCRGVYHGCLVPPRVAR